MEVALGIIGVLGMVAGAMKALDEEAPPQDLSRLNNREQALVQMGAALGAARANEEAEVERAREARERQVYINIILIMAAIIAVLFYYVGYYQGENQIMKTTMGWLPFTVGNN